MSKDKKEQKFLTFKFNQKSIDYDEEKNIGIVKGYASTFENMDRAEDVISQGAFDKTILAFKNSGRPVRMLWQHNSSELIGGYPADKMYIDEKGLFVVGEINLQTQRGREAYALAKQGVLSDFSIGFKINDFDIEKEEDNKIVRIIKELELFEISLVGEPMNPQAMFTEVKSVVPYQDLPIADAETKWSASDAIKRVKEFTESIDTPSKLYKNAFLFCDEKASNSFESYKLAIADVVDGELRIIPKAIDAAVALLKSELSSDELKSNDSIVANINKYYEKMGVESPLSVKKESDEIMTTEKKEQIKVDIDENIIDVRKAESILTKRDFERALRETGCFTRKATEVLASRFKEDEIQSEPDTSIKKQSDPVNEVEELRKSLEDVFKQFSK